MSIFTNLEKLKNTPYLLCATSAVLIGLSRVHSLLSFLIFFAFIPLFYYLEFDGKKLLKSAAIFSFVLNTIYLHWVTLVTFWGVVGIAVIFSLYFYGVFFITKYLSQSHKTRLPIIFLFAWMSLELFLNFTEFRFPWLSVGYAFSDFPLLIQIADIGGVFLISIFIILVNIILYGLFKKTHIKKLISLALVFLFWIGYGVFCLFVFPSGEKDLKISVLQPNISNQNKHRSTYLDTTFAIIDKLADEAKADGSELLILPESVIPKFILKDEFLYERVFSLAKKYEVDIFLGFIDYIPTNEAYKYTNSAKLISAVNDPKNHYNKNILVPFGERVPLLDMLPFLWSLKLGQANWEYGKSIEYYQTKGSWFSPLICFEIAFPFQVLKMAKGNLDFLVNITNDAWFGRSIGTTQHAQMAQVRAVEVRKAIFRSANTGYSTIVSPMGKVLKKINLYKQGVVSSKLPTTNKSSYFLKYFYRYLFVFPFGLVIFLFLRLLKR